MSLTFEKRGRALVGAWSLVGGVSASVGSILIFRAVGGGANAHIQVMIKFVPIVGGMLLLHAGPLIAGQVQRSWRFAAFVAAVQPMIASILVALYWLLTSTRVLGLAVSLAMLLPMAFQLAAAILLVNLLPIAIGAWRRSWRLAWTVALLQPVGLLIAAVFLLLTVGFASPR